jgi:hypothetical protein
VTASKAQSARMTRVGTTPAEPRALGKATSKPDAYATVPLRGVPSEARPWEGALARKPWEYRVTATFAVLDPTESVDVVVDLLRAQTERPYIVIVDTGSEWEKLIELHRKFADSVDVEIHSIRSRGWRHASSPVGASLDVALATCHTPFLYATHDDVFLKRRDYIADLIAIQERTKAIAVGYQMSPRDWLTDQWEGMVSHTATLFDVASLFRIGATWSFERCCHKFGLDTSRLADGWWDTETTLGLLLKSLDLKPELIGTETNFQRHEDDNLIHCRSYTGSKFYGPDHHLTATGWVNAELDASRQRLAEWRAEHAD